jgi:hypothetical protein
MEKDMADFRLLAHPWWVNLLVFVPLVAYVLFRHRRTQLTTRVLFACAIFALSFGFVEAAVAIYLGVAFGLLPGHAGTLSDLARVSSDPHGPQADQFGNLSPALLTIEVIREAATMLMLLSVALLAEKMRRERLAIFLWTFALWDTAYYISLWGMVRWPDSPTSSDVLFFIPVPWIAQVWFPVLVSILTLVVVILTRIRRSQDLEFR